MENEFSNLNGFNELHLPDILPGSANEIISVNNDATDYILIPTENVIPEPISGKQILNSTNANVWDWTNDPKAISISADTGNGNGFKFDQTTSRIISELNTTKIINQGVERVLCTATGVDLKGPISVDNLITCPQGSNFGLGISANSTRVDFGSSSINLRIGGSIRLQASTSGVSITGGMTQTANITNTNTSSGTTTHTGIIKIDKGTLSNALEIIQGDIISTSNNTNITSTNGTASMGIVKANTAGTNALAAIRVVDDNTGLYQSTTGNLDLCASGVQALNINSTRIQNQITFSFNKCPAFSNGVYNFAQVHNIQTGTQPILIALTPTSGNLDFEFSISTNYFSGQEFRIITRNVGAGSVRYRAQSTTYHITGGGAAVTIAANTYRTLVNDRYHILICNVDSNYFYLIQT